MITDLKSTTEVSAFSQPANTGQVKLPPSDPLANKETFLQLLVAQIKNQNPLSPQDGVEFLSQLAQFTDLEQSLGMRQDIAAIKDLMQSAQATQPNA